MAQMITNITIAYTDQPFCAWRLKFKHISSGKEVDFPLFDEELIINSPDLMSDEAKRRAEELAVRYLDKFYPGWK